MPFPQREYYRLEALEKRWDVDRDDIDYAIENGLLRACIWLPMCFVEKGYRDGNRFIHTEPEQSQGLVALRKRDSRRVLASGEAKVCCFVSLDEENVQLRLSQEEPEQEPVLVSKQHLVVSHRDCEVFETKHDLLTKPETTKIRLIRAKETPHTKNSACFTHSNNYQMVTLDSEKFTLGMIQANIVKHLHQASNSDDPWVHGKILLYDAGSHGQRLRDVFKSQKDWHKLIQSDGKGHYCLNLF